MFTRTCAQSALIWWYAFAAAWTWGCFPTHLGVSDDQCHGMLISSHWAQWGMYVVAFALNRGCAFVTLFLPVQDAETQVQKTFRSPGALLNDLYGALWDETDEKVEHYTELLCRPKWYCYWDAMSRKDVESRVHEFRAHQSRIGGVSLRYVLSNEFAQLARRRTGQTNPTSTKWKRHSGWDRIPLEKTSFAPETESQAVPW